MIFSCLIKQTLHVQLIKANIGKPISKSITIDQLALMLLINQKKYIDTYMP